MPAERRHTVTICGNKQWKSVLNEHCQRHYLAQPEYKSRQLADTSPHEPLWISSVTVKGKCKESGDVYTTKKDAENSAAKAACDTLMKGIKKHVAYTVTKSLSQGTVKMAGEIIHDLPYEFNNHAYATDQLVKNMTNRVMALWGDIELNRAVAVDLIHEYGFDSRAEGTITLRKQARISNARLAQIARATGFDKLVGASATDAALGTLMEVFLYVVYDDAEKAGNGSGSAAVASVLRIMEKKVGEEDRNAAIED